LSPRYIDSKRYSPFRNASETGRTRFCRRDFLIPSQTNEFSTKGAWLSLARGRGSNHEVGGSNPLAPVKQPVSVGGHRGCIERSATFRYAFHTSNAAPLICV